MTQSSVDDEISPGASEQLDRMRSQLSDIDRLGRGIGASLGSAFTDLAVKGRSFESVLSGLALKLSNIALRAAFKPLEQSVGSGLSNLFSGSSLTSGSEVAGPSFAFQGGAGSAQSGLGPSAQAITVNIAATDIESFRRSETQVAAVLARSVARGQRNL